MAVALFCHAHSNWNIFHYEPYSGNPMRVSAASWRVVAVAVWLVVGGGFFGDGGFNQQHL